MRVLSAMLLIILFLGAVAYMGYFYFISPNTMALLIGTIVVATGTIIAYLKNRRLKNNY